MVTHRLKSILTLVALSLLTACGQGEAGYGTVSLALTAKTDTGVMYRLRGAEAILTGPTYAVIDLDAAYVDSPVVDIRIATGDYEFGLKPGWYLERNDGGGYAPVAAELISPNSQHFSVAHEETTSISLNFQAGEDALSLATGGFEVALDVIAECEHGEWVARGCGPGYEGSEVANCINGQWGEFGPCELPDPTDDLVCGGGTDDSDTP